ncbi:SAM-dependent methyltransferase [Actinacidiphila oryziradicis]|uniref:Class I SAM-dependent methyltransferase n=1 Tax=Actinacidiphila oryziradicis TaxID=2571141 RepID=A0A4U0SU75_9ACTN|nr:class I SAM-dependent methyltransferase [Actinacidiphila oryziradicis]TKA11617.1 class I SAM-dependent methyltransferase [Actinacidiphila oryziradicis]
MSIKNRISDPGQPGSLAHRARARRWAELQKRFPALGEMRVLDLGGVPESWRLAPVRPVEVVTVNLDSRILSADEPGVTPLVGDACAPPVRLRAERFDLVYSNSLFEHVGGHANRLRLAETVHRMSGRHWIQTPNRYFPIEPHWVFPGFQFLPVRARAEVSRHWPFGNIRSASFASAVDDVAWVELLSATEMRQYFPDSEIWRERIAGLPKSLVAVCQGLKG